MLIVVLVVLMMVRAYIVDRFKVKQNSVGDDNGNDDTDW